MKMQFSNFSHNKCTLAKAELGCINADIHGKVYFAKCICFVVPLPASTGGIFGIMCCVRPCHLSVSELYLYVRQ